MTDIAERQHLTDGRAKLEPWRPGVSDDAVLALRAGVWGADHPHTRPDFFQWLFGDGNPAGEGCGVLLRRSGKVIGFAGLCPRRARVDRRDVAVAHGLDYMVDRSLGAAGSGRYALRIAAEWARMAAAQDFAFGINFPNENSRRLLTSTRLGWREILSPRLMVRPLRGASAGRGVAALGKRLGMSLGAEVLGAKARLGRLAPEGAARPLSLGDAADAAAVDDLWRHRRDDTPVSLCRDAATLRWRYERHPFRRYELLGWHGAHGLSALVVTTLRELEGLPAVLIVDVLFDGASPDTGRALIGAAVRAAAAEGACIAVAEAEPGTALARAAAGSGFVTVPRRLDPKPFAMVALPLAKAPEAAFSRGAWQFAWGDMDVV